LAAEPARCERVGVKRYPTWLIAGSRWEGVLTLDELARASRFTPSGSQAR
jgi:hypothetical protein